MDPNKFRESRQEINRLCDNINTLIEEKELEASTACHIKAISKLDILKPQAEGEIQERSVKNLGIKMNALLTYISKLKPKKTGKRAKKNAAPAIVWSEDNVGQLSPVFLKKVFKNMENDTDAAVSFGTTGKGIRPSYQVKFASKDTTTFSGSSHAPLKRPLAKASDPFSYGVIDAILKGK